LQQKMKLSHKDQQCWNKKEKGEERRKNWSDLNNPRDNFCPVISPNVSGNILPQQHWSLLHVYMASYMPPTQASGPIYYPIPEESKLPKNKVQATWERECKVN
jgi:hypothetical protein